MPARELSLLALLLQQGWVELVQEIPGRDPISTFSDHNSITCRRTRGLIVLWVIPMVPEAG